MAEVVDAIIAELIARDNGYTATLEKAIAVHERFSASVPKKSATGQAFSTTEIDRYTSRHKQATGEIASSSEQSSERVKRAKKSETDTSIAEDGRSTASAERAAKTRADVEIAEAERSARSRARINSATYGPPRPINIVEPGTGRPQTFGFGNPSQGVSDRPLPVGRASAASTGAAAAETEINHALADQIGLQGRLTAARGADRQIIQDELFQIQQMNRYIGAGLSELEATAKVEADLLAIEELRTRNAQVKAAADAAALEKQIAAQSAQVSKGVSLFAGALVGGITVAELSHLNDEYIKFSNSLKVAGVSALDFDSVQQHLLQTSVRTGTNIGALSDTYRSIALASHDLGASQADILKVTDAVANSLRITGASGGAARAAILQLGHAFETGRVTAREFNGLALNAYPVLQAAAAGSDKYAGSVAKLRQALLDGDLTSKEFFANILAGSDQLKDRAAKAGLTTAQGFTALNNALIIYFGTADKAQGISAALGRALETLAENLDILIPAIAAVGTALITGYVTRMAISAAATNGLAASILAAFGGPIGITITAVTLALGAFAVEAGNTAQNARTAHERLVELQGQMALVATNGHSAAGGIGAVGSDALGAIPKVNAFAGAVGNLAQQLYNQARAARVARVEQLQQQIAAGQKKEVELGGQTAGGAAAAANDARSGLFKGDVTGFLKGAFSDASRFYSNLLSGGRVNRDSKAAYSDQVQGDLILQRQLKAAQNLSTLGAGDIPGGVGGGSIDPKATKALGTLRSTLAGLEKLAGDASGKRLDRINAKIANTKAKISDIESGVSAGAANAAEGGGGSGGRRGPSAETLAKRAEAERQKGVRNDRQFDAALRQAQSDQLAAQADITNDSAQRADIEKQRVRFQADQLAKEIASKGPGGTKEYTAPEVAQLQAINSRIADLRVAGIDQGERRRIAQDTLSLDKAGLDNRRTLLQSEANLADTTEQRRKIALQILDLEYQIREKELRATLAPDSGATANERKIAQGDLNALPGQKKADEANIDRQNEGVGASYLRSLKLDRPQFVQSEEVKLLEDFNAGLDDSVKKALHLHGIFGDIIGDLIDMAIKQALIKPLAGALFGGGGNSGGGSGLGGIFGSILGGLGGGGGSIFNPVINNLDPGIPGLATGGTIGGFGGIDKNVLSINGSPVARVGRGEMLTVSPNVAASNQQVSGQATQNVVVVQPIHADFSGARTDEQTMREFTAYADARSQQAYAAAVKTSGSQVGGIVNRKQTLGTG